MVRKTLTANHKYPVQDCENLQSPIQMQLSLKPENFSDFFCYFWNQHLILNILKKKKKKMIVIVNLLRKLHNVKDFVKPLSKKHCFRTPFDSQHVKGSQTFVKFGRKRFHHIFHHSERS